MDHNTGLQVRGNYPFGLDRNCGGINKRTCGIRGIEPRPGPGEALYEGQRPYRGLRRRKTSWCGFCSLADTLTTGSRTGITRKRLPPHIFWAGILIICCVYTTIPNLSARL